MRSISPSAVWPACHCSWATPRDVINRGDPTAPVNMFPAGQFAADLRRNDEFDDVGNDDDTGSYRDTPGVRDRAVVDGGGGW